MNKILFVSQCYPSKEDTKYGIFVHQLAKGIKQKGIEVDTLKFSNKNEEYIFDGIHITNIKISNSNKLSKNIFFFSKKIYKQFSSFLKNKHYDFIIFHINEQYITNSCIKFCKKAKIKTGLYLHGLNVISNYSENKTLFNIIHKINKISLLKKFDFRICVSTKVLEITNKYISTNNYVINNGVDLSIFYDAKNHNQNGILCVGNLTHIKGQIFLLQALKILKEAEPNIYHNISVTLVGKGPEKASLVSFINENDLNNVCFIDDAEYYEVSKLMQENMIFILPSFFESFGCVYLEALASGMIVVGCKNQGSEDFLNQTNSILIEERSSEDIALIIKKIMSNEINVSKLVKNGIETSKKYTWEKTSSNLINILKEL